MNSTRPAFSPNSFHQLPPEAAHFTTLLSTCEADPKRFVTDVIGSSVLAILAILAIPVASVGFFTAPPDRNFIIPISLAFGAFLAYAAFNVFKRSRDEKNQSVRVYTEGLIFERAGKIEVFSWNDIESVWQSITTTYINGVNAGTAHIYRLRSRDGRERKFDDSIRDVKQLGHHLQNEVGNQLLPRFLKAFDAGEAVKFGTLEINRSGLNNGKNLISWDEVKSARIADGRVMIKKHDKWLPWSNTEIA